MHKINSLSRWSVELVDLFVRQTLRINRKYDQVVRMICWGNKTDAEWMDRDFRIINYFLPETITFSALCVQFISFIVDFVARWPWILLNFLFGLGGPFSTGSFVSGSVGHTNKIGPKFSWSSSFLQRSTKLFEALHQQQVRAGCSKNLNAENMKQTLYYVLKLDEYPFVASLAAVSSTWRQLNTFWDQLSLLVEEKSFSLLVNTSLTLIKTCSEQSIMPKPVMRNSFCDRRNGKRILFCWSTGNRYQPHS